MTKWRNFLIFLSLLYATVVEQKYELPWKLRGEIYMHLLILTESLPVKESNDS